MAIFERDGARLAYDVEGDGYPVLLIAPGGMRSTNDLWNTMPWNPRERLAAHYQVIGMDQRNAGRSTAPVSADDGWDTYAADHLGLLDHLGIDECHVVGMCIGGPYIMNLLLQAPDRFRSALLLQPVGIEDNMDALREMFDGWAADLGADHPGMSPDDWQSFRNNMWHGEFVVTASREQVAAIETPMFVAMGNDMYHPESTSREIAELAPNAILLERWKDDDVVDVADVAFREFLASHTPA